MNEWYVVIAAIAGFVVVIVAILVLARVAKKHEPPSPDCNTSRCSQCQGLHSCSAGKMIVREQEAKRKADQISKNSE